MAGVPMSAPRFDKCPRCGGDWENRRILHCFACSLMYDVAKDFTDLRMGSFAIAVYWHEGYTQIYDGANLQSFRGIHINACVKPTITEEELKALLIFS